MNRYRGLKGWGRRRYRRRRGISGIAVYIVFIIILGIAAFIIKNLPDRVERKPDKDYENIRKRVVINKISRSAAYKRGMDIINYVWEYAPSRNGKITSSDIALPEYLRDGKTQRISGIPYCWGGYLSLDTSNKSEVKNFQEAISKGYVSGNVVCEGGYKDFTAGLDCSGFVSAVFNLPEKCSTQTLKYYFDTIDIRDIKPMDIFNSEKNHTFVFIRETPDKRGIITMESTTSKYASTKDKTVINYRSWESIKKGVDGEPYVPMRYRGIGEDEVTAVFDEYEFNDTISAAFAAKPFDMYKGTIDYVDDVDYFKLVVDKKKSININILGIPDSLGITLLDNKGNIIETFKEKRIYTVNLNKGSFYIKISGRDFKFSSGEEYIFYIGN